MLSLYHCSFVTTCDRNDIIGIDRNAAILRMQVFAQLGRMNYCMHEWSNVCEQTLGGLYRLYTIRTTVYYTTSHYATPCHATPRHATPRHATPRHATPRHATPRHATPRHATPRHTTPHHTTLPYIQYTTLHYTMLHILHYTYMKKHTHIQYVMI